MPVPVVQTHRVAAELIDMADLSVVMQQANDVTIDEQEKLWEEFRAAYRNQLPRDATLVKYNGQTGEWTGRKGAIELDAAKMVPLPNRSMQGPTFWQGGKRGDQHLVTVPGRMKERSELPDRDPSLWVDKDFNGQPKDPWSYSFYLLMLNPDNLGEKYIWIGNSPSAWREFRMLVGAYSTNAKMSGKKNIYPVVELASERVKNNKFGSVYHVPRLDILKWMVVDDLDVLNEPEPKEPTQEELAKAEENAKRNRFAMPTSQSQATFTSDPAPKPADDFDDDLDI
jgi:hypothetical protein